MRLSLVGPYNSRPSSTTKDRRFINCQVISASDDLRRETAAYCIKRPGWVVALTPQAGSIGNAIYIWNGISSGANIASAFGATNSTIYVFGSILSNLGNITGLATGFSEAVVSGTPTLLITSADNTAWYYPDSGALTKITDSDFPGNAGFSLAGNFAVLDGYAFIMTLDAKIFNSDLNSVTSWTASNYFSANAYPDKGIACIRHRNSIVAFGNSSFEVLKNVGSPPPGSPLTRIVELTQKIGALNANSVINIFDVIYFAGVSPAGSISIYAYDGATAKPISTSWIDQQLLLSTPLTISLSVGSWNGVTNLIVKTSGVTYAYGIGQPNPWFEMASSFSLWDRTSSPTIGNVVVTYGISTTNTGGIIYVVDASSPSYLDAGASYTATIQTATSDEGTNNRKAYTSIEVIGNQETSSSTLNINWTDNDYVSLNPDTRTVDLSSMYRVARSLGTSRKRAWKLTHAANTGFQLQALDIGVKAMPS